MTELERRTIQLIEVITGSVTPDSWDHVGGPGSICAYNGLFTVSQTDNAHRQVEHLLDMLRKAAGLDVAKGAKVMR
jgi:general secretion pathway protein D